MVLWSLRLNSSSGFLLEGSPHVAYMFIFPFSVHSTVIAVVALHCIITMSRISRRMGVERNKNMYILPYRLRMIIEFDKESVIDFAAKCNIRGNTPRLLYNSGGAFHTMDGKDETSSALWTLSGIRTAGQNMNATRMRSCLHFSFVHNNVSRFKATSAPYSTSLLLPSLLLLLSVTMRCCAKLMH